MHCCQRRAPAHSDFPFIAPSLTLILDMTPAAVISSVSYILHCCQPGAYAHFYFPFIASLVPQSTFSWKLTPRYMSVGDPVVESMRARLAGSGGGSYNWGWGTRLLHSFFQISDMNPPSSIICTRLVTCGLAQASKASLGLADLRGMDFIIEQNSAKEEIHCPTTSVDSIMPG